MTIINGKNLTLNQVYQYLDFQKRPYTSFDSLLHLEPLSEFEQSELAQIRDDFESYLTEGKVLENMVMVLTVLPILRLTGFYRSPIKMKIEEDIEKIRVEDEDMEITGRMDLVCINKDRPMLNDTPFYILVVEAKNSSISSLEGLPQLSTYAHQSLAKQRAIWGLTTNGVSYDFFYIEKNAHPTYQPLPSLQLVEPQSSAKLLQVLKAISHVQNNNF
ncbi:MAG: restriction endonuclease subunit R [Microcystaceae cyanobacterium]